MKNLKQKKHAEIMIDNTEPDVIIIWFEEKDDPQCVHIERENIPHFISMLQMCGTKDRREK